MSDPAVEENVANIVENISETAKNVTEKIPATPEGIAVAYGSLVLMALLPIFFGAYRSVKHHADTKASGEKLETMTSKDAAMFPLVASTALFGLYVVFSIFPKEYVNMLLSAYFFCLGIFALTHIFGNFLNGLIPSIVPLRQYHLLFTEGDKKKETHIDFSFSSHDIISAGICSLVALWYLLQKHWIANNVLGLAFAISGVEMLNLNSYQTGALLLSGLFLYDIFWVFGTNVMVTVAKSFDAPIKLVFPQDLLEKGLMADNFAMLGLGDIVIPGIFIALLLRFDRSLNRGSDTYFKATFLAYLGGLLATIFVMHVYKHAQPALLYLVPACLGVSSLLALCKGDFKALIKYEDCPEEEDTETTTTKKDK